MYSPGQTPDGSSRAEVVINVVKICCGSGMLALPYAYVNGGYGFSIIGECPSSDTLYPAPH
jgi:amino acid permease